MVGDIITKLDGVALAKRSLDELLSSHAATHGVPRKLTVLRPKGEIPLEGSRIARLGADRFQITPSLREVVDGRPPYVLIADGEGSRNDRCEAIEASGSEREG